jgi:hypothetical protein
MPTADWRPFAHLRFRLQSPPGIVSEGALDVRFCATLSRGWFKAVADESAWRDYVRGIRNLLRNESEPRRHREHAVHAITRFDMAANGSNPGRLQSPIV